MIDRVAPLQPDLAGLLAAFEGLDDQDITDALQARVRARRRLEAEDAAFMRVLHSRIIDANRGFVNGATAEIGLMLGISGRSAEYLVETGYELTARSLVWQALHDGLIDTMKARKIVALLEDVPDPQRSELEKIAIGYATDHTPAQLHRRLVRMTCDEDPEDKQRQDALARRHVAVILAGHGMAFISAYVSLETAQAFMQGIDDLAGNPANADPYQQGDARSLDQRRADALTGFINDHSFWDVTVQVQIPADMLMGVETKGADLNGSPCTRRLALHLAWSPDARWTRLVTDPLTGVLLDTGTTKYQIPAKVRTAVRLRDRHCRFPGCTRPAEYTDTDHVIPHRQNGLTHTDGLACLCRYHHRIKTFEAWQLSTNDVYAHSLTWRGPLGTTATTRPHDYRPSTQHHPRRGRTPQRD
ncbi:MAG: DUF222 domain-containing protein [Candidatus Nanopelagicales bacterium]